MGNFNFCDKILELSSSNKKSAEEIIRLIQKESKDGIFVALDCLPKEKLNPFHYQNGLKDVKVIMELAGSSLKTNRDYLEKKIIQAEKNDFKTDFSLGEKIGLWKRIAPNSGYDALDWSQPFVIKNKFNSTKIWHPDWREWSYPQGFATRGAIISLINEGSAYVQKFHAPLLSTDGTSVLRMIYRLIFFCKDKNSSPEFIGGLWICRPGFKIYLGPGSLAGLISPISSEELN